MTPLTLAALPGRYAVCRLPVDAPIPDWLPAELDKAAPLCSLTRTDDELSIVCPTDAVPDAVVCEQPFRAVRVVGTLDFALVGVLNALTRPLADAGISVLALSTYDTDYLLVNAAQIDAAAAALRIAGHTITTNP